MNKIPGITIAATAGLASIISSCSTASLPLVMDLRQSPSFTRKAMLSGKLCIGGVAASPEAAGEVGDAEKYALMLEEILRYERKDIPVASPALLTGVIGHDAHALILDRYSMGDLHQQDLPAFGRDRPFRYLLMVLIDADRVTRSEKDNVEYDMDCRRKVDKEIDKLDQTARLQRRMSMQTADPYESCKNRSRQLISRRSVGSTISIYDLERGLIAWSGRIAYAREKTVEFGLAESRAKNTRDRLLDGAVGFGRDVLLHPLPPETEEVLRDIFTAFTKGLP